MQKRILQLNREHYRIDNYDLHLIWNSYLVFDKCPRFKWQKIVSGYGTYIPITILNKQTDMYLAPLICNEGEACYKDVISVLLYWIIVILTLSYTFQLNTNSANQETTVWKSVDRKLIRTIRYFCEFLWKLEITDNLKNHMYS